MATHVNHPVHAKLQKVEDKAEGFLGSLSERSTQVVTAINSSKDKLVRSAKKHPAMAIAVASGTGFLLGFFLKLVKR